MRSTSTSRGQTVVPAEIRRQFGLSPWDALLWVVTSGVITFVPVKRDRIAAFRGPGPGGVTSRLIADRVTDQERE